MPMVIDLLNDPNTPKCIVDLVSQLLSATNQLVKVKELSPHALKGLTTVIDMINSLPLFLIF
jgi:hypothetical protein